MKIKILGTKYEVMNDDLNNQELASNDGICKIFDKKIIMRRKEFMPGDDERTREERYQHVLRHELIHAVAQECGVSYGDDENLVDWIAHIIPIVSRTEKKILETIEQKA